jgi:hypothetical protein
MCFAEVAVQMRITPWTLQKLLYAAQFRVLEFHDKKNLSPEKVEQIREAVGPFVHCLHQGKPNERPCVFHGDVAKYLEIGYTTYRRWMKLDGLKDLLPLESGRRCLLPAEVNRIVETLALRAFTEKGGRV